MSARRDRRWLLLFPLVYLVLALLVLDPGLDTGGDNAVYLILARSLAAGTGYADLYLPDAPAHTQFPPGFPVLLSFVARAGPGTDILLAKFLVLLAGAAAVYFVVRLFTALLPEQRLPALALLVSVPMLVSAGSRVLSEIPYLLLSMATLWLLVADDDRPGWRTWLGVVLAAVALLFRTAGVALVLAVALQLAMRRRFVPLAVLAGLSLAVLVPWQLRAGSAGGGGYLAQLLARDPYVPEFGRVGPLDVAVRLGRNLASYGLRVVPGSLAPVLPRGVVAGILGVAVAALVAVGFHDRWWRWSVTESYAVFGGGVLLAWPEVWADGRFLLPLLPLLVLYFVLGLVRLGGRLKRRRLVPYAVGALVVLNAVGVGQRAVRAAGTNAARIRGERYAGYSPGWQRYFEACDWIDENVGDDAVVLARKPEFVYLWTGNRSFRYPFSNDRARVLEAVERSDYILFDNFGWTKTTHYFLNPVLQDHPGRFRTVHETAFPQFFVLQVVRPGRGADASSEEVKR